VADTCIVNASPLIFLAKAACLEYLRLEGETVLVPGPVAAEILGHSEDAGARALGENAWLIRMEAVPVPRSIQAWDLGDGESSVLAMALATPGSTAILDDLAARRCAAAQGIPVRGCVGLVLRAKRKGRIPLARPVLDQLRGAGLYLSDSVVDGALSLVGE